MPPAIRAASTCPGTRAARARTRGCSRRSASAPFALDIPALTYGIDVGDEPTPFHAAQQLAAEAWGAKRTLVADQRRLAGEPRGAAHARAPRPLRRHPAERALEHDRRADHVGAAAHVRVARAGPGAAHRALHDPGHARPRARRRRRTRWARRWCRRPTSARSRTWRRSPRWRTHTACRWWSTRRGARTSPSTRTCPAPALSLGADLVISSIHKVVGSLTQSAMIHLGHGDLIEEQVVDRCVTLVESTSPSSILNRLARRRAPDGRHARAGARGGDARGARAHARGDPRDPRARRAGRAAGRARRACSTTTRCGSRSTCAARA